ncbi:MAG: Mur ligase family protein, partial [Pseudomonadota bacterium]
MDRIEELETALTITSATADTLRVEDARRLTGPGLLWDRPGAVIDLFFEDFDPDRVTGLWQKHARHVLDALGWPDEAVTARQFQGGVNLAISAPMDQLYSSIFAAQTAWHFCAAELLDQMPGDFEMMVADVKAVMAKEANPALIALIDAAKGHGVDILCDDDEISVGHGTGSQVWPADALPDPDQVDWSARHDVPIAFVTGTNGKTTTTRLCAAIARAAGKTAGLTSTDFVRVGEDILDRGDYSGPGGARMLLRDPRL